MATDFTLSPLLKAHASLVEAVAIRKARPDDKLVRDAVIQRFEYTYELAWKAIKRFLETVQGENDVDQWSRRDLFRVAAEQGLVTDPRPWFTYNLMRNLSSTYHEETAERVVSVTADFSHDCEQLIAALRARITKTAPD